MLSQKIVIDIDFGESPEVMKSRYMDVYDNIYAEVVTTSTFDENVDLSTMYLGRIDMKREEVLKAEESFPISEQGSDKWQRMSNIIRYGSE